MKNRKRRGNHRVRITTINAEKADSLTQDAEREANRRRSERVANQRSEEEDQFEQGMLDAVRKFRKEQEAQETTSSSKKGKK